MMHEYARVVKLEGVTGASKSFTVLKFRTLSEVCRCVEQYQETTCTHFIKYNRDKHFGNEGELVQRCPSTMYILRYYFTSGQYGA